MPGYMPRHCGSPGAGAAWRCRSHPGRPLWRLPARPARSDPLSGLVFPANARRRKHSRWDDRSSGCEAPNRVLAHRPLEPRHRQSLPPDSRSAPTGPHRNANPARRCKRWHAGGKRRRCFHMADLTATCWGPAGPGTAGERVGHPSFGYKRDQS